MAGADEDLPGHQVGYESAGVVPEVSTTPHEVVLVAPEAVVLSVAVVLQQVDPPGDTRGCQVRIGLLDEIGHDELTGAVLSEHVLEAVALGGGELGVGAHVQVKASAPASEDVRGARALDHGFEELTSSVVGVHGRRAVGGGGAGDAVLGLHPDDAPRQGP